MYLIPKNIKVKKEIFKGIGIVELVILSLSLLLGFIFQSFFKKIKIKVFVFFILPLISLLLIIPLPNGTTSFIILKKFIKYKTNQKCYKFK